MQLSIECWCEVGDGEIWISVVGGDFMGFRIDITGLILMINNWFFISRSCYHELVPVDWSCQFFFASFFI